MRIRRFVVVRSINSFPDSLDQRASPCTGPQFPWRGTQSIRHCSLSSCWRTLLTHSATRLVYAKAGFPSSPGTEINNHSHHGALAALPITCREILLSPATSATECIIAISEAPTKEATLPEASVETMSLGTPIGKALIPAVTIVEFPEPPMPRTGTDPIILCKNIFGEGFGHCRHSLANVVSPSTAETPPGWKFATGDWALTSAPNSFSRRS